MDQGHGPPAPMASDRENMRYHFGLLHIFGVDRHNIAGGYINRVDISSSRAGQLS